MDEGKDPLYDHDRKKAVLGIVVAATSLLIVGFWALTVLPQLKEFTFLGEADLAQWQSIKESSTEQTETLQEYFADARLQLKSLGDAAQEGAKSRDEKAATRRPAISEAEMDLLRQRIEAAVAQHQLQDDEETEKD